MGIESDAVVLFIGSIIIVFIFELIAGLVLLTGKERKLKRHLLIHIGLMMFAFFSLFNCYFHTLEGFSNMTYGIGLFILAWTGSVIVFLKMMWLLR